VISTLRDFQYIDEQGKDQGINGIHFLILVREKSKTLVALLSNESRLAELHTDARETAEGRRYFTFFNVLQIFRWR
jgi:hypothetical protein